MVHNWLTDSHGLDAGRRPSCLLCPGSESPLPPRPPGVLGQPGGGVSEPWGPPLLAGWNWWHGRGGTLG